MLTAEKKIYLSFSRLALKMRFISLFIVTSVAFVVSILILYDSHGSVFFTFN